MLLDNRYGFMPRLPDGAKEERTVRLPLIGVPPWCTTAMVPDAVNHCASVMAVNLLLALCGPRDTLAAAADEAYQMIGPGPVVRGIARAKTFLLEEGVRASVRNVLTRRGLMAALENGRPAALLVIGPKKSVDWHWVVACGFTILEDRRVFWHIADGWHENTRYFTQGLGCRWVAAGTFRRESQL